MKKVLLSAMMFFGFILSTNAQEISKNAIGLRLGDNDGFGGEISYQRGLSDNNRLEFDLGWRNSRDWDGYKLVGLYQWVWNIEGGFNWYAGAGAGIGSWNHDFGPNNSNSESGTYVLAAGDIGIEYNFDFPLLLSLDFRPEFYIGDGYRNNNFGPDIALGVRYQF